MTNPARPLSPHLSVYRWPITMILSILHRMTGVAMSVGFIVLAAWLIAAAGAPADYDVVAGLLGSWFGRLVLIGFSFAFFLHLCNGIRHLLWDAGYGFEKSQANRSGTAVAALTIILTLAYWWLL